MTDVTNPRKTVPDSVAAQLIAQARAEGVGEPGRPGQSVGGVDQAGVGVRAGERDEPVSSSLLIINQFEPGAYGLECGA